MMPLREKHRSWPDVASSLQEAAERFHEYKRRDPFPEVPAALLNSADIHDYTRATGMIHPFDPGKLKSASYEACVGAICIFWDSEGNKKMLDLSKDKSFVLTKNSIAFVTTKEKFQLPDYMAVRFNLRINLVHRGLLLETGPLVDPGFVGHILIPLHNLTNNDYKFDYKDRLIWLEFTKISPNERWHPTHYSRVDHRGKYVDFPDDKKNKELHKYLERPKIRSSIPDVIHQARKDAEEAKQSAELAEFWARTITAGGILLGIIAALAISISLQSRMDAIWGRQETTVKDTAVLQNKVNKLNDEIATLKAKLETFDSSNHEVLNQRDTKSRND